jgi:putative oxidoreductase
MDKLNNIVETAQFFAKLGIPWPEFHAYFVGYCELIGGSLLVLGFASRLISIPLIVIMLTALSTAHAAKLTNFQFILDPRALVSENPYPFLITVLLVFFFGPGRLSLDALVKRWVSHQPKY